jgi:hypothetical protein
LGTICAEHAKFIRDQLPPPLENDGFLSILADFSEKWSGRQDACLRHLRNNNHVETAG